jgi:hemerythrin
VNGRLAMHLLVDVQGAVKEDILEQANGVLDWDVGLSVGIAGIDKEHQAFIIRINELNRAVDNRYKLSAIRTKMQTLLEEWKLHSAREEALLRKLHYPDVDAHARQHEQVNQQLHAILAELDHANFGYEWISASLKVRDTLLQHLLEADMQYRDYCRSRSADSSYASDSLE